LVAAVIARFSNSTTSCRMSYLNVVWRFEDDDVAIVDWVARRIANR